MTKDIGENKDTLFDTEVLIVHQLALCSVLSDGFIFRLRLG